MNKELAQQIFQLSIEDQRITQQKFDIKKRLNNLNWDSIQTDAMRFLLEENQSNLDKELLKVHGQ